MTRTDFLADGHRYFGARCNPAERAGADLFIGKAQFTLVSVEEDHARLARYLAEPLLFKGRDFVQTDVERHPASGYWISAT